MNGHQKDLKAKQIEGVVSQILIDGFPIIAVKRERVVDLRERQTGELL